MTDTIWIFTSYSNSHCCQALVLPMDIKKDIVNSVKRSTMLVVNILVAIKVNKVKSLYIAEIKTSTKAPSINNTFILVWID